MSENGQGLLRGCIAVIPWMVSYFHLSLCFVVTRGWPTFGLQIEPFLVHNKQC